jgi:hypothetical protein
VVADTAGIAGIDLDFDFDLTADIAIVDIVAVDSMAVDSMAADITVVDTTAGRSAFVPVLVVVGTAPRLDY